VIAGGTALMLAMRQRMLAPTHLISVAKIERLHGIDFDAAQGLRIGALARHSDVARSPLVRQHASVLASMATRVANPQVRNQGTMGGNLCYGDPSTDPPGCLMALDAQVVLGSARGERVLSMQEFLLDYFVTALEPDELVLEIRVPPLAAGTTGVYTRYLRTAAEHRPLVSVALWPDARACIAMRRAWWWALPRRWPRACRGPRTCSTGNGSRPSGWSRPQTSRPRTSVRSKTCVAARHFAARWCASTCVAP
jgi:CO/xanthine dehydrogenase FAD-binding subunit